MKTFLVIGASIFGHHLCKALYHQGAEILLADQNEEAMEDLLPYVVSARVCDCTNLDVLRSFGINNFDACFVCLDNSVLNSLEITDMLKELGAKKIICKAVRDIQVKFLLRNGADYVIYPDKDVARQVALTESSDDIFNSIQLAKDYYIFEIKVLDHWVGKSLKELDFRNRYHLTILGTKSGADIRPILHADYIFEKDSHIMVVGHTNDIQRVIRH